MMTMLFLLAASKMVVLHTLRGESVLVNPQHVTALFPRTTRPNRLVTDEVNCVINLVDGKFISVRETCDDVRRMLAQ